MFDIRIHIHCPDLVAAAELLAGVRASRTAGPPEDRPPSPPEPSTLSGETPHTAGAPSVSGEAVRGDIPDRRASPERGGAPAGGGGVFPADGCTVRDVARAGAALLRADPGLQPRLRALLTRFGARSAMELKPEQLPAFADALRNLGAKL